VASFGQNDGWPRRRAWLRSAQQPGTRTKADQGNPSGTVASFGQGRNWVRSVKTVGIPVAARALASFGARGVGFVWSEAGELELGLFGARALGSFGANNARTHAACKGARMSELPKSVEEMIDTSPRRVLLKSQDRGDFPSGCGCHT
jgi:hypothetical protein